MPLLDGGHRAFGVFGFLQAEPVFSRPPERAEGAAWAAAFRTSSVWARWKIENEGVNPLKTQGTNREHTFGHGGQNRAALPVSMNLLAFARHTLSDITATARQKARQRFFQDVAAITGYLLCRNGAALIRTRIDGAPLPPVR